MSIISPFKFGRIVTGDSFINRSDEKIRIRSNILSRNNTIIISPRRWGKSSLVKQVASEMDSPGIRFVFLDIYNIRTEEDFFTAYSSEIIKATITRKEEVLNTAKQFFKRVIPVISFSLDPLHDFSLKFNWEEAKDAIGEIIDLPEKIAKDKGLEIIVCIDEFQNIARIRDYEKLEETLRSYWQLHEQVSYCLYGSKRHMMIDIFNRESRPFYRFGDIIMLGKIREDHWIDFIIGGFKDTGKSIPPELAKTLISTAGNHPEYVQQLAHHTWSLTEKLADELILNDAIELVMNSNSIFYQEICDDLSNTQINLMKAVFQGETQFTSADVMQKYNLGTPRNVSKNKEILEAKDILDFSTQPVLFNDPFFKIWFQRTFL
jgi:uncharacterized protein